MLSLFIDICNYHTQKGQCATYMGSVWQGLYSDLFHKITVSTLIPISLLCDSITTEAKFSACFLLNISQVISHISGI